jgi:hypothetical protein
MRIVDLDLPSRPHPPRCPHARTRMISIKTGAGSSSLQGSFLDIGANLRRQCSACALQEVMHAHVCTPGTSSPLYIQVSIYLVIYVLEIDPVQRGIVFVWSWSSIGLVVSRRVVICWLTMHLHTTVYSLCNTYSVLRTEYRDI